MRYYASIVIIAALVVGCGGGDDASGSTETAAPQIPLAETAEARTDTGSEVLPAPDPDRLPARTSRLRLRRIGTFNAPTYVTAPRSDRSRLFVVEQQGTIRVIRNGRRLARPFLDIRSDVSAGGERGLLSMAFDPNYARSGLFYVYFTGRDGDIHIQEFRRSSSNVANRGTRRELVRIEHSQHSNHNGGQLQFGPDGRLYAGTGDGGGGGDPFRAAQNPRSLLGKLLRFDAARRRAEVYSSGLRNPWRFSFDRRTGDLTVADVGQNAYEEVNWVRRGRGRGKNFGWSRYEGRHRYYGGSVRNYVPPVIERSHDEGWCSITGGYVVRDRGLRSLYGRYVYGDYCEPGLRWARFRFGRATSGGRVGIRVPGLSSFGEDARGRLYAVSLNGPVYRFVD
jgi:glucose/arabinose dehydrogenase